VIAGGETQQATQAIFRETALFVFFEAEGFEGATGKVDSVSCKAAGEIEIIRRQPFQRINSPKNPKTLVTAMLGIVVFCGLRGG